MTALSRGNNERIPWGGSQGSSVCCMCWSLQTVCHTISAARLVNKKEVQGRSFWSDRAVIEKVQSSNKHPISDTQLEAMKVVGPGSRRGDWTACHTTSSFYLPLLLTLFDWSWITVPVLCRDGVCVCLRVCAHAYVWGHANGKRKTCVPQRGAGSREPTTTSVDVCICASFCVYIVCVYVWALAVVSAVPH